MGAELGVSSESFTAGTDDGMGGRHAMVDGDAIILLAKHYFRCGYPKLKSKILGE